MTQITVRKALQEAMTEEMIKDDNVFIMGEEVAEYEGAYKVTEGLLQKFGDKRVIDTPITEHGFTGVAIGAAFNGLKPIVEFMTMNFAMQAIDQIINSAAKTCYMSGGQVNCPIVFRAPNGAASQVAAQHSQCYASWYAHIPGLKVIAPYSATDAKGLLKTAIQDPNPIIFLENEILYGHSFELDEEEVKNMEIGKARIVKPGKDITIVGYSISMHHILEANKTLEKQGVDAEIIDLRTIQPLDINTIINSVKKTNKLLTVEEGWGFSAIASEVNIQICEKIFDYLDIEPHRITGKQLPLPYAKNLEKYALPSKETVISVVHKMLKIKY